MSTAAGAGVRDDVGPAPAHAAETPAATAEPHRSAAEEVVPDPFTDADALEELGDEIATLAAHIHAATERMLELVAEFDRRRGWELGGHRSCAHWLAARTGIDLGAAREKVRASRVLVGLPETSAAMARGELSFSQVRALTRVATAENEAELLQLARGCTTAQIERMVRGWRLGSRQSEEEREELRHRRRTFSIRPGDDGMYVVSGRLTPEVGALVMRAVEAASDAVFAEESWRPVDDRKAQELAAQRRADALGLLAERALGVGFGGGACSSEGEDGCEREGATGSSEGAENSRVAPRRASEATARPCGCAPAPISGTRAERYLVVLHVDSDTLSAEGEPGRSELDDGTRVSAETSRRLSCDAGLVTMSHGADGSILNVGRKTRTIPPALRRALEARDRGCRFPGCGLRFTDGHHVQHWEDGGETSLANCVLLCKHHHRLVHEGGWTMGWWGEGRPVFYNPLGHVHFDGRWRPEGAGGAKGARAAGPGAADALIETHHRKGICPGPLTAGARWKREADIPDRVLFAAAEALADR